MGRKAAYTAKALEKAIARYFRSISRTVSVTEEVDSGERDDKGHVIYTQKPIINDLNEEVKVIEFAVPPTVEALCDHLGISAQTWANYCNPEIHPEFVDTTKRARGRIYAYLHTESLRRPDKMLKGILFDMEQNFPEYGARTSRDAKEQDLRIQKMEAELEAIRGGGADEEGVTIIDDL